jgi:hypothetical protein
MKNAITSSQTSIATALRWQVDQSFRAYEFNVVEGHARAFYFPAVRYLRVFIPKVVHERNMADG